MTLFDEIAAAIDGVPARYVRVVAVELSPDERAAVALTLLNPDDEPWPRITSFAHDPDAGWEEVFQDDVGDWVMHVAGWWAAIASGRSGPGETQLTAVHGGRVRTRPVEDGWGLVVFWLDGERPEPPPPRRAA